MTTEAHGQDTSDSRGTTLTTGAEDTKGSWVELAASTGLTAAWITINAESAAVDMPFLVDIGVGAGGSESVVIANLPLTANTQGLGHRSVTLPISIPSGSRIAARAQAVSATQSIDVSIHLSDETSFGTGATALETLGADETTSLGTVIDSGASANTKGSWTELIAATAGDIDCLAVFVSHNGNATLGANTYNLVDIGIGAAASETVLIPNIPYLTNTAEVHVTPAALFFENISSGTRVAARAQSTSTDGTDRLMDVVVIGCNMTAPSGGGTPKQAGRGGGLAG